MREGRPGDVLPCLWNSLSWRRSSREPVCCCSLSFVNVSREGSAHALPVRCPLFTSAISVAIPLRPPPRERNRVAVRITNCMYVCTHVCTYVWGVAHRSTGWIESLAKIILYSALSYMHEKWKHAINSTSVWDSWMALLHTRLRETHASTECYDICLYSLRPRV